MPMSNGSVVVLDPSTKAIDADSVLAIRPETLDGKVIGLLANGKRNSDDLLELVCNLLQDRYSFKEIIARNKHNVSRPCPSPIIDEMVAKCDVVITATGD